MQNSRIIWAQYKWKTKNIGSDTQPSQQTGTDRLNKPVAQPCSSLSKVDSSILKNDS